MKKVFTQGLAAAATTVILLTSAHAAKVGRDIKGVAVAGSSASAVFLYVGPLVRYGVRAESR